MPDYKNLILLAFMLIAALPATAFVLPQPSVNPHLQPSSFLRWPNFEKTFYPTSSRVGPSSCNTQSSHNPARTALFSSSNNADEETSFSWFFPLTFPLWLVYISNQWSRSSLYYLVDFSPDADPVKAMNVDLGFTQAQYGLLASVVFTILFAGASLIAGSAADQYNRKNLTVASALLWSTATLGTAVCTDYTQVVVCRILMGLACAFSTPAAYTLIQNLAPRGSTSLASSFYGTGVALGGALASLSILLDTELGWRNALVAIAGFGATSAGLTALVLPNDNKTNDDPLLEDKKGFALLETETVKEILSIPRVQWIYLASFLRFSSGLCIGVWSASYFRMTFADFQAQYAVAQAFITAVAGSVSGLLGGALADYLFEQTEEESQEQQPAQNSFFPDDSVGRTLWVPVVGSFLAAPTFYIAVQNQNSFESAMAWLAASYLVAECWFGPTINALQKTVGPKIGGTAQGMFTLTGALANTAPALLGFVYGSLQDTTSSDLGNLLASAVCFGYISSSLCFAKSSYTK